MFTLPHQDFDDWLCIYEYMVPASLISNAINEYFNMDLFLSLLNASTLLLTSESF